MSQEISPEDAAFRNILGQANTFNQCLDIANHVNSQQKEQALKRALELSVHYDEAIYVRMASNDSALQNQAISKAISLTEDMEHLDFWAIKAPTDELKALAKTKLDKLKKEAKK